MAHYPMICICFTLLTTLCVADPPLSLTLIHINDLHARYEPVTAGPKSEDCSEDPKQACVGGFARVVHAVRALKRKYKDYNPLYINAGDNFQGSIWYGFLRWNVTQAMLNLETTDMMTLGNHEFDHGVPNLALFLSRIKWPVICANIKTRDEPTIDGKIAETLVRQFHVKGQVVSVGFIGALYDKTNLTTNTGRVQFENAITAVKRQAQILRDKGINKVIVVSHCGYSVDLEMAEQVGDIVDVIIGGHSHTLLWPKHNNEYPKPEDIVAEYPTVVHPRIAPHRKVLVLHAFCHGKVVGALKVDFDRDGEVQQWDPSPLYLHQEYPQDPETNKVLEVWKDEISKVSKEKIGRTKVVLQGKNCRWGECSLGTFFAMVFRKTYVTEFPNQPIIALIQSASFKGDLLPTEITEGNLMHVFPFDSTVDSLELEGRHIRRSLEKAAILDRKNRYNFFQGAGFRVTYDMSKEEYQRVVDVQVEVGNNQYEPLKDEQWYKVVTISFIANGGDNFTELSQNKRNHKVGLDSRDIIKSVLQANTITEKDLNQNRMVVRSCPYCEGKKV